MPGSSPTWTPAGVRAAFDRWLAVEPEHAAVLDEEARAYVDYHVVRYARLLSLVGELAADRPPAELRILDVGPNVQTALLRHAHPAAAVDTLGFAHPGLGSRAHERHTEFDLNCAADRARWPDLAPGYDVVVAAEVVEHLYTRLATVLACMASWLRPGGSLVIQTPNGAALHKRLRLLAGRSPVEPPRESRGNPGHFHEYTLAELREQAAAAGLTVLRLEVVNYFSGAGPVARAYGLAGRAMPPGLRHGVTLCAQPAR
jgi:SAM-dependent methyltransferase